jgi:SAM-dependent methyltransferase
VPEYDERYYREVCGRRQTRFDRARDERVLRLVERHTSERGPLLDVGCGYGHLLDRFRDRFEPYGVELSGHAAAQATVRLRGLPVVRADVQRGLPFGRRFRVALAINVVEHLEDPKAAVDNIASVLLPGGLCVVHLPTINNRTSRWIYRLAYAKDPTHVYRPSGREVRALFESSGFRLIEESYAPHSRLLLSHRRWHPAYLAAFSLEPERAGEPTAVSPSRRAPPVRRRQPG